MFRAICIAVTLVAASLLPVSVAATAEKLNIVVFLSDDHSLLDCTVYGATDVRTPNMARLAKDGMTFTDAYVASPACAPSRGALLTGLMPARNGAEANHSYPRPEVKLLPAYMKGLGYETAAFGKVAHGRYAAKCGFDHVNASNQTAVVAGYLAKRDAAKPICLFVGTHQPHVPWPEQHDYEPAQLKLPPTHIDTPETREMRARYYQDVTIADTELGEIYDLAQKTFGRNTLFIYTSDHGAQWPFGKWNLYDDSIRTPFIAAWPGTVKPGSKTDAMVSWIDLLPTFIELAGGQPPKDIDGRSFAGVLRGTTTSHRDRIFTTHSGDGRMNVYPIRALKTRQWKYIRNLHPEFAYTTHIDQARGRDGLYYWIPWTQRAETDVRAAAIVKRYHQRPKEELYDLKSDPHEQHNLAQVTAHADRLTGMRAEVDAWMKAQDDKGTVFNTPRLLKNPDDWKPADPNAPKPAKKRQRADKDKR